MKAVAIIITQILMVFCLFLSGCLNNVHETETYEFEVILEMPSDDDPFILHCPFLYSEDETDQPLNDTFLENLIAPEDITVDVEMFDGIPYLHISGTGSVEISSSFDVAEYPTDDYHLSGRVNSSGQDHYGDYSIWFSTPANMTSDPYFSLSYSVGDNWFAMNGLISSNLKDVGWQTIYGEEELLLSD